MPLPKKKKFHPFIFQTKVIIYVWNGLNLWTAKASSRASIRAFVRNILKKSTFQPACERIYSGAWEPIPTIYSTAQMKTSCLQPSWVIRKPPKPRSVLPDQLQEFHQVDQIKSLEDLDETHAPPGYLYHKVENEYAAYYKMCFKKSPKVIVYPIFHYTVFMISPSTELRCNKAW